MNIQMQGLLGIALAGVVAGGCASGTAGTANGDAPRATQATVEVMNNNWLDVNVYAVRSGMRARLGTVTSMSKQTFALPNTMVSNGGVHLMVAPIGSPRTHRTELINVDGGGRIEWSVENSLALSSYTVRHSRRR